MSSAANVIGFLDRLLDALSHYRRGRVVESVQEAPSFAARLVRALARQPMESLDAAKVSPHPDLEASSRQTYGESVPRPTVMTDALRAQDSTEPSQGPPDTGIVGALSSKMHNWEAVEVVDAAISGDATAWTELGRRFGQAEVLLDEGLREAFLSLPHSCQELLRHSMADPPMSYPQISAILGMPMGSIGPRRARCLDRLRRSLDLPDRSRHPPR